MSIAPNVYRAILATGVGPRVNGINGVISQANSVSEAKALAKAVSDVAEIAPWNAATPVAASGLTDLLGWKMRIQVTTTTPTDVTYTGIAGDTPASFGTAMAALLVSGGHGEANAAYNTGTGVLTVASTGNAIGDKTVTVVVTPPTGLFSSDYSWTQADWVGTITSGGSSGSALTVALAPTWVAPGIVDKFTQR